jgi:hypothetical protein
VKRRSGPRHRIVALQSAFVHRHKARAAKIGKVPGYHGLIDAQDGDEIANAMLANLQQMENA